MPKFSNPKSSTPPTFAQSSPTTDRVNPAAFPAASNGRSSAGYRKICGSALEFNFDIYLFILYSLYNVVYNFRWKKNEKKNLMKISGESSRTRRRLKDQKSWKPNIHQSPRSDILQLQQQYLQKQNPKIQSETLPSISCRRKWVGRRVPGASGRDDGWLQASPLARPATNSRTPAWFSWPECAREEERFLPWPPPSHFRSSASAPSPSPFRGWAA